MSINFKHIVPKFKKHFNPKVGLIALSTDYTIESDFNGVSLKALSLLAYQHPCEENQ